MTVNSSLDFDRCFEWGWGGVMLPFSFVGL